VLCPSAPAMLELFDILRLPHPRALPFTNP
jgi:hypothetical protein